MIRKAKSACLAIFVVLVATAASAAVETYGIDPVHSNVSFKIRHLVSNVTGNFRDFSGSIHVNRENMTASTVELTIKATSIDTATTKRDNHLRSPDFFDVEKYPEITFKSSGVTKASGDTYNVTGTFAMHGVTKEITIPVTILGFLENPKMGNRAGFSTSFSLNRGDYGITYNAPMDVGSLMLGDEVKVEINIEAAMPKPEAAPPKEAEKKP